MNEPVVAVVVGAGLGLRYGGSTPKAALKLSGKALMVMSIEAMAAGGCTHAVLVVNERLAQTLAAELVDLPIPVQLTFGGSTRQESVRNGLQAVRDDPELASAEVVLIHDAVRPMVPASVVASVIEAVKQGASAVAPAVPVIDSIRAVDAAGGSLSVDRASLRAIQTPQGFPLAVILAAHQQLADADAEFTDDLSCTESAGHQVVLVPGSRLSMKITEPTDLIVARGLWQMRETLGHHSSGGEL